MKRIVHLLSVFMGAFVLFMVVGRAVTAVQAATITVNSNLDTADPTPADGVCDVDPGTAGNQCTLRGAIQTAQGAAGADVIEFADSMDINLSATLPTLSEPGLFIEAATGQTVRINGQGSVANIFQITGSYIAISNVVMYGSGSGWSNIWVTGAAEYVVIAHNLIGDDDPDDGGCGQSDASFGGVYVDGNAPISEEFRVWLYGNVIECHIQAAAGDGVTLFGTDNVWLGQVPVGVAPVVAENVIRHNQTGIHMVGSGENSVNASVIENNQGHGVWLDVSSAINLVGCGGFTPPPDADVCRNRIRGNEEAGVYVTGNMMEMTGIANNWIGLADDGVTAVPNNIGIHLSADSRQVIVISNTISGNTEDGVRIQNSQGRHWLMGNVIGLGVDEETAVPNGSNGVMIFDDMGVNLIGGTEERFRNIISGNNGFGIRVDNTVSTSISFNSIGVTASGARRGNGYDGISLSNSQDNAIGVVETEADWGTQPIVGNGEDGIHLENVENTLIGYGNDITDNDGQGVYLLNGNHNLIFPYRLSHNGDEGALIAGATSYYNPVFPRMVERNGRLPIDLGLPGLEPNDPGDVDDGPNHLLNFPEVTVISGTVITGTACGPCVIAVYEATGNPTQNGGGGIFRTSAFTDLAGVWSVDLAASGLERRPVSFIALTGLPGITPDIDSSPLSPVIQLGYDLYLPLVLRE